MSEHVLRLLITQIWQIAALAIIVAVVVKLAARNRPHLAHALWVLVLIKCVTPPLWGHSLGVFSVLQTLLVPDESASLRDVTGPPKFAPVAITENVDLVPQIAAPVPEYEQFESFEPDNLLSLTDTEPSDAAILTLDGHQTDIAQAEPPLSLENVASHASGLRHGWLLLSGLLAGAMVTLLIMVIRCLRCLRLIHHHRTTEFDAQLCGRIQQLSKHLRIRRIPQIIVSDVLFGPAVLGLLRHTIVLPRCLFEKLESPIFNVVPSPPRSGEKVADRPDEGADRESSPFDVQPSFLDPILAHELLHIRRGDLRTGTLQAIVQSLWWFHPAVWLSNRWLSREAERCCDEQVIAELGCTPGQYARSLLSVIECKHQLQPIPLFPGMKPVEITAQRMERIMSLRNGLKKRTPLWCWLMIVAMAFVVLPGGIAGTPLNEAKPLQDSEFSGTNGSKVPLLEANAENTATKLTKPSQIANDTRPIAVQVRGLVHNPGFYEPVAGKHFRVLDAIDMAGGASDDSADMINVIRRVDFRSEPAMIQISYKRGVVSGMDPNIPLLPRDEVVLRTAEAIEESLTSSIRLDDNFVLSPDVQLTGETVIVFVHEKPITVAVLMRNRWVELQQMSGLTEVKRQTVCRAFVESKLPQFVFEEAVLWYFRADLATIRQNVSGDVNKADSIMRFLPSSSSLSASERKLREEFDCHTTLDEMKRSGWVYGCVPWTHRHSIDADKGAVIRHVRELLLQARLRTKVTLKFEDAEFVDVIHQLATKDHNPEKYDGPPAPEWIRKSNKAPPRTHLVPDRPMPPAIQQSSDPLVKLVWDARESTRKRLLSTDRQTPWQLMHGLLGLRQDFLVNHDGKIINGLEWIQSGPTFKDEPPFQEDEPWFQKTKHGGRAHPYSQPYLFEGHINQFAAILASCGLPLNAQFGTPDGPITMQDLITNAQMTANEKEEVSWTLSFLSRYLPPDAKWVNAAGEEWSIERLVKVEVGKALGGPCGGTCGLFALAVARDKYLRAGKPLEGVWLEADQKIQKYIELARTQQNADGTLSSNYFKGGEAQSDFDKRLASSGALLQFLMMAASDEQLKENWLRRAVEATVNDLLTNRNAYVSCSPLFETTNALNIYLDRSAVQEVTDVQPESREIPVAERLVLCSYPVADLVVYRQAMTTADSESAKNSDTAQTVPPAALALVPEKTAAEPQPRPVKESQQMQDEKAYHADFAPLTELIKATVQPESWTSSGNGTISIDKGSLSLVIRQTQAAHEEIADLLPQLRNAEDQTVRIHCRIFELSSDEDSKWLEEQVSLHELQGRGRWALLSQQRSGAFQLSLKERKPNDISAPLMMTISGQTGTIQIGSMVTGKKAATGIRLEMTPYLLPDSKVIRLQHSFSIGEFANEMPQPFESLVGSGQTLLLLIDDPEDEEKPDAARSQYLLMMTPERKPPEGEAPLNASGR